MIEEYNYAEWAIGTRNYLKGQDLWENIIEDDEKDNDAAVPVAAAAVPPAEATAPPAEAAAAPPAEAVAAPLAGAAAAPLAGAAAPPAAAADRRRRNCMALHVIPNIMRPRRTLKD